MSDYKVLNKKMVVATIAGLTMINYKDFRYKYKYKTKESRRMGLKRLDESLSNLPEKKWKDKLNRWSRGITAPVPGFQGIKKTVNFIVGDDFYKQILRAATDKDLTLSEWIRRSISKTLKEEC